MAEQTVIWDTQSGKKIETVEADSGSWQRNRDTEQRHVFHLPSLGLNRAQLHDIFGYDKPRDRVLAHIEDGVVMYHGLILDSVFDDDTETLSVIHRDVRELASGRWLHGIGGYYPSLRFQWSGLSWRGIASRIAEIIFTAPISGAWPIPMQIPAAESGGESLEVWAYSFRSGENLLAEIEEREGGPDIDFAPTGNGVDFGWQMRIGAPYLTGQTIDVYRAAPRTPVRKLQVETKGREKATGIFGIGDGSEQDMVVGGAAAAVSAGLARDDRVIDKMANLATINSKASARLGARLAPARQYTLALQKDQIRMSDLQVGATLRLHSSGSLWIPDGWSEHRISGYGSTVGADTVELDLETISG